MPYKRILFPIDFSRQCARFGPYVAAVARRFGAEVTLLHAVDSASMSRYELDPAMSIAAAAAEATAESREKEIHTFLRGEFASLNVKRICEPGEAVAVITRYVLSNSIDLIMTPTHGHGAFRRLLLGSITAEILRDAECAVWTAAHLEQEPPPAASSFRNILCALDLRQESVPLLRTAARVAAELGASLRLIHAVPMMEAAAQLSARALGSPDIACDSPEAELDRLQSEAGTSAELCIEPGDVAKAIGGAAVRYGASLVVIGRGRMQEALGSLRTHTYSIVKESPCPVLSVYLGARREKALETDAAVPISLAIV